MEESGMLTSQYGGKQTSDAFLVWAHMWFGFLEPQNSWSGKYHFWTPPSSWFQGDLLPVEGLAGQLYKLLTFLSQVLGE